MTARLVTPSSSSSNRRYLGSIDHWNLWQTIHDILNIVVGPSFWNALPSRLRSELLALSMPLFSSRLKTILFDHGLVLLGREGLGGASPEEALYKLTITITNQSCSSFDLI